MSNVSNESRQISVNGRHFVAWIKRTATDQDLQSLSEIEYSDDKEIWIIRIIDRDWMDMVKEGKSAFSRRSLNVIDNNWSVYLPADRFDPWPGPISEADRARQILEPLHLSLTELPDDEIIRLSVWLTPWVDNQEMPSFGDEMEIYEMAKMDNCETYPRFAKSILPIFKTWMNCKENMPLHVHAPLRLAVAVLQRHTGRVMDAIQTTEFISQPTKGDGSRSCDKSTLALLSSTRSAALMDRAVQTGNSTYLVEARKQADRVNAITGRAMELYIRLKATEKTLKGAW